MAASNPPAEVVSKRYEALMAARCKAVRGTGAWYWAHFQPVLVNGDSGDPIAVKLRCSLCNSDFSASNPSRTASEHRKRGTCPNFSSSAKAADPKPISSLNPFHKGNSSSTLTTPPPPLPPAPVVISAPYHRFVLSGGKEDLDALSMLEDSVKRLKSPMASADAAVSLFADWFLETAAAGPAPSSLDHPKLRSFFHHVSLPAISRRRLLGPILNSRFREARAHSHTQARDALYFQLDSSGWNSFSSEQSLVSLSVNLPNDTTVFHGSLFTSARAPSDYAEDVLRRAASAFAGYGAAHGCAGVVADRFKSKALRNLEAENPWMVNLHCQLQGFRSLIRNIASDFPLFRSTATNCATIAAFFNTNSSARTILHKHHAHLLHCPPQSFDPATDFDSFWPLLEDVKLCSHSIRLTAFDEDYKVLAAVSPAAGELAKMIGDERFWYDFEAVHSLIKLVKNMAREMEAERPLVGRCLPLWEELRQKVKNWRSKYNVDAAGILADIVDRRFKKNYHSAWSAAFILDPLNLTKDAVGKYLPPFKHLSPEQGKDVDRLITRLVSPEEADAALMELTKWRTEGLDPLYAQAVQVKQLDPATGKMKVANRQSSRLVWETCLGELRSLGRAAVRLIFLHCTTCRVRCSPALLRQARRSPAAAQRVEKIVFLAASSGLERRSFCEEAKDAEIFGESGEASAAGTSL